MNSMFDRPMVDIIKQSMETAVINQIEQEYKFDLPDDEDDKNTIL